MKASTGQVLTEGVVAGLLGALAVAVVVGAMSVVAGRSPFYVPWVLGSVLVGGDPQGGITPGPIAAFNGVHVVAALALGLTGAFFVYETERYRGLWYLFGLIVLLGLLFLIIFLGTLTVVARPLLTWPVVIVGNLVGLAVTGGYLWALHRRLVRELRLESGMDLG